MSYVLSAFIILSGIVITMLWIAALMWLSEKIFERTRSSLLAGGAFLILLGFPVIVMGVIDLGNYIQLEYRQ